MTFKVGNIVFSDFFGGPCLVTAVVGAGFIDVCILNQRLTNEPQGLSWVRADDYRLMEKVPEMWRDNLHYWLTRAICSTNVHLTMTYEAGQGLQNELERLGLNESK
tara:strand:+ start:837 stop:1154 length:318 start_codon:yes stop_codon:yes gene_type:complete